MNVLPIVQTFSGAAVGCMAGWRTAVHIWPLIGHAVASLSAGRWDVDGIKCLVCGEPEPAGDMLLCDLCNAGCHAHCAGVALDDVGEYWYCPACWAASDQGRLLVRRDAAGGVVGDAAADGPLGAAAVPLSAALDSRTRRLLLEQQSVQREVRAPVPLEQWDQRFLAGAPAQLSGWLRGRLAESSHSALATQRGQFTRFLELSGMPLAATAGELAHQLACWVMGRAENGFKLSTIELGIYAVQDEATRASGWRSLSQDVQLRDALAVARR